METLNQVTIREKLKKYFDTYKNDYGLGFFDADYNNGISFLWLYAKWLQVIHPDFKSPTKYCDWFRSTIELIKTWDEKRQFTNQEIQDIEKLIALIEHFYHFSKLNIRSHKEEIQEIVKEINLRAFKTEYSIASLFTLNQLKELLKIYDLIQNNKLVLFVSRGSTTAFFKNENKYYCFNPNGDFEETQILSTYELAEFVFKANSFVDNRPSPLGLIILSAEAECAAIYPTQKDILDYINPALIPEKTYADEISGLTIATYSGSLESVQYFLDKKVDPNIASVKDSTPLMFAASYGYLEILKTLLKNGAGVCINMRNDNGYTAIMFAAYWGYLEIIKELLAYPSIELNLQDKEYNKTALMCASKRGYSDIVRELLKKQGIDPNLQNKAGWTALMYAAYYGHLEVVKELLIYPNIESNVQDKEYSKTALMYASQEGYLDIVKELLKKQETNPNLQNQDGWTVLIYASEYDYVGESLKNEINVHNCDQNKIIVFNAKQNVKLADVNTLPVNKESISHIEVVRVLLADKRVDPNKPSKNGTTVLLNAIAHQNKKLVDELLKDTRVDFNQKDNNDNSPLSTAMRKSIDLDIKIREGQNNHKIALYKLKLQKKCSDSIVSTLIKAGAILGFEQNGIMYNLQKYLDKNLSNYSKDKEFVEKFHGERGFCYGLVILYLYSKFLETQKNVSSAVTYNYRWFKNSIRQIVNWDGENELYDFHNFDIFINLIAKLQDPYKYCYKSFIEIDVGRRLREVGLDLLGGTIEKECSIVTSFDLVSLKKLLEKILLDKKLIFLLTNDHSIGLFKNETSYFFYDPNEAEGDLIFNSIDEVANKIVCYNEKNYSRYNPFAFVVFNFAIPNIPCLSVSLLEQTDFFMPPTLDFVDLCLDLSIRVGCLQSLDYYLPKSHDPNKVFVYGRNILHHATMCGYIQMVRHIAKDSRIDINYCDKEGGRTALIMAALDGYLDIIQELHMSGKPLDLEVKDNYWMTALMTAAEKGYDNIVDYLVDKAGANVNAVDPMGLSALTYAAKSGHYSTVVLLLKKKISQSNLEKAKSLVLQNRKIAELLEAVVYIDGICALPSTLKFSGFAGDTPKNDTSPQG